MCHTTVISILGGKKNELEKTKLRGILIGQPKLKI
jgi:hypothetical protein